MNIDRPTCVELVALTKQFVTQCIVNQTFHPERKRATESSNPTNLTFESLVVSVERAGLHSCLWDSPMIGLNIYMIDSSMFVGFGFLASEIYST